MGETLQGVLVGLAGVAALVFLLWRWRRGSGACETCHRHPGVPRRKPDCEENAPQDSAGDGQRPSP